MNSEKSIILLTPLKQQQQYCVTSRFETLRRSTTLASKVLLAYPKIAPSYSEIHYKEQNKYLQCALKNLKQNENITKRDNVQRSKTQILQINNILVAPVQPNLNQVKSVSLPRVRRFLTFDHEIDQTQLKQVSPQLLTNDNKTQLISPNKIKPKELLAKSRHQLLMAQRYQTIMAYNMKDYGKNLFADILKQHPCQKQKQEKQVNFE